MTAIWVLAIVLAVLCGLLSLSLSVHIVYDKTLTVRLYYGFVRYTVTPRTDKPKKKVKQKKRAKSEEKAESKQSKDDEKGFFETVTLVLDIIKAIAGPTKRLLGRIRIEKLDALVVVAGEDAAETSERYGKTSAVVYGAVVALKNIMRVGVKSLFVGYDFTTNTDIYRLSLKIKLRGFHLLTAGFGMIKNLLAHTLKGNNADTEDPQQDKNTTQQKKGSSI